MRLFYCLFILLCVATFQVLAVKNEIAAQLARMLNSQNDDIMEFDEFTPDATTSESIPKTEQGPKPHKKQSTDEVGERLAQHLASDLGSGFLSPSPVSRKFDMSLLQGRSRSTEPGLHSGMHSKPRTCSVCQLWLNQTEVQMARVLYSEQIAQKILLQQVLFNRELEMNLTNRFKEAIGIPLYMPTVPIPDFSGPLQAYPYQLLLSFPFCSNEHHNAIVEAIAFGAFGSFGMHINVLLASFSFPVSTPGI